MTDAAVERICEVAGWLALAFALVFRAIAG